MICGAAALEAVLAVQTPQPGGLNGHRTEHRRRLRSVPESACRLRYLARFDDLSCNERLRALDDAIERAITGSPEPARDFVRDVMDGRVKP
jgi:hypothetical protein